MNYNIKGSGVPVTDELRSYAERQLAHADKLLMNDPTAHADVELTYDENRDPSFAEATKGRGGKYGAEFTLTSGGEIFRAVSWGLTLHEAMDLSGAELVRELAKAKKKKHSVFRRTAVKVKEYLRGWRSEV